jgi:alkylation response protein AidB-like acyl-CoA dehydrogenase
MRRNDYSLSEDQQSISRTFADFFRDKCPSSRVRAAEPLGFDEELWREFLSLGAVSMAGIQTAGQARVTLLDMALIAEQYGRYLAPLPLIEAIVCVRLLSGFRTAVARDWAAQMASGTRLITIALQPSHRGRLHLVPAAAIADAAILFDADELIVVTPSDRWPLVSNQASSPTAWVRNSATHSNRVVIGSGERASRLYAAAIWEWKLLTAAALSGLGHGAVELAVEYAKNRYAFGVPIGTFQAVSHSLVDAAIAVEGSSNLTRKAAWFVEHEIEVAPGMVAAAYMYAVESATRAATVGVHVQGGFGFTLESDAQLYFRRGKGWPVIAGDPRLELSTIADALASPHPG